VEVSSKNMSNERDKENDELRSKLHALQSTLDHISTYIFTKDLMGRYTYANRKVCDLFNYPLAEIIGCDDSKFFDLEKSNDLRVNDLIVLQEGKTIEREECNIIAETGEYCYFVSVKKPLIDSNGMITGMFGVATDITDIKLREKQAYSHQIKLLQNQKVLLQLTKEATVDRAQAFNRIISADAENLQINRVSIWFLNQDNSAMTCDALYDQGIISHENMTLKVTDYPRYFEVLNDSGFIAAEDAQGAPSTNELSEHYLKPLGITSMLDAPIRINGKAIGIVCHEHVGTKREWTFDDKEFARSIADICAQVLLESERKQVENQLRDSEQRLRLSQASGGIGTWEYDFITDESICSRNIFQQLKFPWSAEKSSWDDVFAAIFPEDHAHVNEVINRHIAEGSNLDFEYRITDTEGETRWMRSIGEVEFDADGNPLKMRGTIQDITVQKSASEKLQLSARVFNDTHEGITITNAQQEIIDINPAFSDITGYSRDEIIGQNPSMLSSGKQSPEFYAVMWKEINKQGYWQGEVWNRKKTGELYAELLTISTLIDDNDKVINYVGVFTDITHSKQQQEKLSLMAHYDILTGLPNRALFVDRFHQAIARSKRTEHQLAVCFLDLDNFKPVNDNYGHDVGDQLLVEVAQRITASIREVDTVSRQGGDEFALLLNDMESYGQCELAVERILHALAQPYLIDDYAHNITASIGVTLFPDDNEDIDTLIRHADNAMYQAKQSGKHRYHFFDRKQDQQLIQKHHHLTEIERALVNNELILYYQPKINMATGEVFGAEALMRWLHPEKGLIPPLDFLPLIDGTDLELQVGDWVINQALQQMECWLAQGINLEVSVNIASHHLQSTSFFTQLDTALAKHPAVDSQQLQIEILESSALSDLQTISRIIKTCQEALGVSIALDDFGTGYSSLTHLKSLTANTIKIDQSFVRDMLDDLNDYVIIDGIIGLAESFNRGIIAEGVETTEHGLMLLATGCYKAQGYGIARPMPADKIPLWLSSYMPDTQWKSFVENEYSVKEIKIQLLLLSLMHWKNSFENNIQSEPGCIAKWPELKRKKCHCGVFIKQAIQDKLFDKIWINELEATHTKMHIIANNLFYKYQEGNVDSARDGLDEFQIAVEKMTGILE